MARLRGGRVMVDEAPPRARTALPALSEAKDQPPRRLRTFASLRHRNYLLLWIGSLFSNTGDWMDQVTLNWLVSRYPHRQRRAAATPR